MLKRIKKKEEFLYDVPFTTGSKPTRGLYTLVWLEDGTPDWEQNGKLIANPNWTIILNSAWQNLHFSIHKPSNP